MTESDFVGFRVFTNGGTPVFLEILFRSKTDYIFWSNYTKRKS